MFTAIALILQIGAFAIHAHHGLHENHAITITSEYSKYSHHCDICDAVLKIAIDSHDIIAFINSSVLLPYYCLPTLSINSFTVDKASSRAPPLA